MRKWSVNIYILDEDGQEHTADCFQRVVYNLHPSFENPVQSTSTDRSINRSVSNRKTNGHSIHQGPLHLRERGLG